MLKLVKRLSLFTLAAAMILSTAACSGTAQSSSPSAATSSEALKYPEKDIRIIVAFAPGGQTDLISRKLSEIIQKSKLLNASILVVNMPGGNTADAADALCKADPDGYTFYMHHTAMITNNVMGTLKQSYKDMKLCGGIVDQGFALVARTKDDRFSNGKELVDYIRANPGELTVGFPGYASAGQFALISFLKANNLVDAVKEVPYAGGAEAITAHLSGETDLRATNMGDSARYVASGDINYLCMISHDRNPDYPDVQSLADLGSTASGFMLHTALFAPQNTPDAVCDKFMETIDKACETDEFKEFLKSNGLSLAIRDSKEITKVFDDDYASITDMAKLLKKGN